MASWHRWKTVAAITKTACAATGAAGVFAVLQPVPLVYVEPVSPARVHIKLANAGLTLLFLEDVAVEAFPSKRFETWDSALECDAARVCVDTTWVLPLGPQRMRPLRDAIVLASLSPATSDVASWNTDLVHHLHRRGVVVHVTYRIAHNGPLSWLTLSRELPLQVRRVAFQTKDLA
jgi:hypothetical protein